MPWLHSIISSIFFLTHTSATFFLLDHLKLKIIQHDPSTWVFSFPSSILDMKPALHFSGLPETRQTLPRVTDSTRPTIGDLTFSKMQLPLKMIYHNSRLSSWQMGRRGRLSEGPQKTYNLQSSIYSMFPWKWNATNKNIFWVTKLPKMWFGRQALQFSAFEELGLFSQVFQVSALLQCSSWGKRERKK